MIPIMLITDEVAGGIIGGFGSLLTGGINAIAGSVQNKKQRQHDKDMLALQDAYADENATVAYQRQLDMWNKQNAYNDPSAQMARLRRAGLNPAMIQGSNMVNQAGSMSSAPQSSGGSGHVSQAQPIRFEDPFTKALSAYAQFKQLDLVDAQTKDTMQKAISGFIDNLLKGKTFEDAARLFKNQADEAGEDARAKKLDNDLADDAYKDEDGNIVNNPKSLDFDIQKGIYDMQKFEKAKLAGDVLTIAEDIKAKRFDNVIKQINSEWYKIHGEDLSNVNLTTAKLNAMSTDMRNRSIRVLMLLDLAKHYLDKEKFDWDKRVDGIEINQEWHRILVNSRTIQNRLVGAIDEIGNFLFGN